MGAQILLALLQIAGALTLIPWPAVLAASAMALGAERKLTPFFALMAVLPCYPLLWAALYVWSWRLLGRGAATGAFAISSVPAAVGMVFLGWLLWGR